MFSFILSLPPLVGWSSYTFIKSKLICTLDWSTELTYTSLVINVIGGSTLADARRPPPPPQGSRFFLTLMHTKFSKRNRLGSPRPPLRGPRPPMGNPGSATECILFLACFEKKGDVYVSSIIKGTFPALSLMSHAAILDLF